MSSLKFRLSESDKQRLFLSFVTERTHVKTENIFHDKAFYYLAFSQKLHAQGTLPHMHES